MGLKSGSEMNAEISKKENEKQKESIDVKFTEQQQRIEANLSRFRDTLVGSWTCCLRKAKHHNLLPLQTLTRKLIRYPIQTLSKADGKKPVQITVTDDNERFCDRTCLDVVEEFNKLTERGSVEDYQEKFEDLRSFMLQYNLHLNEEYFVSSFVSGLTKKPKLDLR
ncbi:hypothetical protein GOBAR_AA19895 [Gossypium barbadense]|uniref:Uncharacterized protein n=1 Tax=Gossypium barbadense TaxID=3634 RepID=A0A2P5XBR7_GOSBA|nr:hypothetical protein GOBAR_AA19895 [Gossypium barbadense]